MRILTLVTIFISLQFCANKQKKAPERVKFKNIWVDSMCKTIEFKNGEFLSDPIQINKIANTLEIIDSFFDVRKMKNSNITKSFGFELFNLKYNTMPQNYKSHLQKVEGEIIESISLVYKFEYKRDGKLINEFEMSSFIGFSFINSKDRYSFYYTRTREKLLVVDKKMRLIYLFDNCMKYPGLKKTIKWKKNSISVEILKHNLYPKYKFVIDSAGKLTYFTKTVSNSDTSRHTCYIKEKELNHLKLEKIGKRIFKESLWSWIGANKLFDCYDVRVEDADAPYWFKILIENYSELYQSKRIPIETAPAKD